MVHWEYLEDPAVDAKESTPEPSDESESSSSDSEILEEVVSWRRKRRRVAIEEKEQVRSCITWSHE